MSNLAPCPDCGVPPDIIEFECGVALHCDGCGSGVYGCDEDEALATWNRRAPALRWRRKPPDVPGWWWRKVFGRVEPVYIDAPDIEWFATHGPHEWAGPIVEPE